MSGRDFIYPDSRQNCKSISNAISPAQEGRWKCQKIVETADLQLFPVADSYVGVNVCKSRRLIRIALARLRTGVQPPQELRGPRRPSRFGAVRLSFPPEQPSELLRIQRSAAVIVGSGVQRVQPLRVVRKTGGDHDKHAGVQSTYLADRFQPSLAIARNEYRCRSGRKLIYIFVTDCPATVTSKEIHQITGNIIRKTYEADQAHGALQVN
jgi:hypothetical protein